MLVEHFLSSDSRRRRLRVAVIVDGMEILRPYAAVVQHLLACDFATVAVVVRETHARDGNGAASGGMGDGGDGSRRWGAAHLLYRAFERWDAARTSADLHGLVGRVDVSEAVAPFPVLPVARLGDGPVVTYADDVVDQLGARDLDVALRLVSHGRLAGRALTTARYGVWSYRLGDEEHYREGLTHFWELAEDDLVSAVSLVADLPGRSTPLVLRKGFASSVRYSSDVSVSRNRVHPLLLGTTFFIAKLKQLHERGFEYLEADATPPAPYRGTSPTHRPPSNAEMLRFLVPRVFRKTKKRRLLRRTVQRWRIGIRVDGAPTFQRGEPFDLGGFRWIEPPAGMGAADPHLIDRGGETYCFYEDYRVRDNKGRISCARIDSAGDMLEATPVLERPYHLSYPFVFHDGGEAFMIPESSSGDTVDLYRATEFPSSWQKERTLLPGAGLDTTVVRHDGLYWFFVALREPDNAPEQLLLYFSESLTSPLQFHPGNPISVDIRACRPAGSLFWWDGALIRPSQDSSGTYGRQLHFNRILTLTPERYQEQRIATVPPPAGMQGVHTYNRCGRFEVVDGKRRDPAARVFPTSRFETPRRARP